MPTFTTRKPGKGKAAEGVLYLDQVEPPAKGQRFFFDDHRDAPRGFGFRVTQAGGRAFVLQYIVDGRQRRKTIGDYPTWTLEAARAEASKLRRAIDTGADPLEDERKRKAERREPLVADFRDEFLRDEIGSQRSARAIQGYIDNDILPKLGKMQVCDVSEYDVEDLVKEKAKASPRAAVQVLHYARHYLRVACRQRNKMFKERAPLANPAGDLKAKGIKVSGKALNSLTQTARGRILDNDELRNFWTTVEACGLHRLTAAALKLVLVTGQRPGEVAGMHRDEINGDRWTIPASRRGKTESEQTVHLTKTALTIIAEAEREIERLHKRRREPWSGLLFETRPGKAIANSALSRAAERSREAMKNKPHEQWGHWTPHDLRRTMRTGLSACKIRPDIAELTIGHAKRGIVAVYDQHGFDAERQAALEAWEARLLAIVEGQDPDAAGGDNVVKLEARA